MDMEKRETVHSNTPVQNLDIHAVNPLSKSPGLGAFSLWGVFDLMNRVNRVRSRTHLAS